MRTMRVLVLPAVCFAVVAAVAPYSAVRGSVIATSAQHNYDASRQRRVASLNQANQAPRGLADGREAASQANQENQVREAADQANQAREAANQANQAASPEGVAKAASAPKHNIVDDQLQEMEGSVARTRGEIQELEDVPRELDAVARGIGAMFLPQFEFQLFIFAKASLTILFAFSIFICYFGFIYENDRKEDVNRWQKQLDALPEDTTHDTPDTVIVWHHPSFPYADKESVVSLQQLKRVLVNSAELPECRKQIKKAERLEADREKGIGGAARRISKAISTARGTSPRDDTATLGEIRQALLKDIFNLLGTCGFDAGLFSSIDNDELFMGVTLHGMDSTEYYMSRRKMQLQLSKDFTRQLGLGQDPDDPASTPPYMPYETHLVRILHKQGLLNSTDPKQLFRSFEGQGDVMDCLRRSDCIRLIFNELSKRLNLNAAIEEGFLVSWYPLHDNSQMVQLMCIWANWGNMLNWSFVQPIGLIREYFGARIAFTFAWGGTYTKALLALVIVAVSQLGVVSVLKYAIGLEMVKTRQVIGFSICVLTWSRLSDNLWHREEAFFLEQWNMGASQEVENIIRPEFMGDLVPSKIDSKVMERVYPWKKKVARKVLSFCFTIFFCAFVALCIMAWLLHFEGDLGIASSCLLSLCIKIFNVIFTLVVPILTDFENHKHRDEYYNHFLWKLFLFEFVNNYSAFFFLTVFPFLRAIAGIEDPRDCGRAGGACLEQVRVQVKFTLAILGACTVMQVPLQVVIVRLQLKYEIWQAEKKAGVPLAELMPKVEEEAKYGLIDDAIEVQNMMTLIIPLGFVLLFGGVCVFIVPCVFCVFVVHNRAFAVLLSDCSQRTFPNKIRGMGAWSEVVTFLMYIGMVYSGFLFVAYGESFRGTSVRDKMTGFLMYLFAGHVAWALIDAFFPRADEETQLLAQRRNHVIREVNRHATSSANKEKSKSLQSVHKSEIQAMENGDWDAIPQFHATPDIFSPGFQARSPLTSKVSLGSKTSNTPKSPGTPAMTPIGEDAPGGSDTADSGEDSGIQRAAPSTLGFGNV